MIPVIAIAAIIGLAYVLPAPPNRKNIPSDCVPDIKKDSLSCAVKEKSQPVIDKNHPDYWKTGEMFLVVGASQSGKTYWVQQQIATVERLLTWDIEQQYEKNCIVVTDVATLAKIIRKNNRKCRISYQPQREDRQQEFLDFCRIAFCFAEAGLTHRNADNSPAHSCIVVEELASVTSCGKAPTQWGDLVRMGLKRNMWLYAVTQRPTEIDKTTVGNCSQIHCCGVATHSDAELMRKYMDLSFDNIRSLNREHKQFIHKNCINSKITVGGIVHPAL